ncbi:inhibitor of KinA [Algoriphagus locisalis]|uniref:Inhibitor of KinA n=1 Tax=Algoriphagus locisalis TaxID=305507 RepID=A0A1I7DMX2_9BACT|nr:5-oxoprolinase subunit PxpB [Algoriphagus locisalis]SFU12966.1 inhibitor of KinA [Algoriphagus locisalis]
MKPQFRQISPLICEFEWEDEVSDKLLQQQISLREEIKKEFDSEISEVKMGFKTLSLRLSNSLNFPVIKEWLASVKPEDAQIPLPEKIWQIPVCYSKDTGRDLQSLAEAKNIAIEELIALHSQPLYRLHFYGFLPGFMYLNGLPKSLFTPRKSVPDREVPAGSVAIGGSQTGIYPSSSPGGWHLIGQTPIELFNPKSIIPVFAEVGERIEFTPISSQDFERLKRHPQQPNFR